MTSALARSFEPTGRGVSSTTLLISGIGVVVVTVAIVAAMISLSEGTFQDRITVTAEMSDLGDGLPAKSDVKYDGLLVGSVTDVTPSATSGFNDVTLKLDPAFASSIPASVTARIIPSNVFAVPAIELVNNGSAGPLRGDMRIRQDTSEATIRLQAALTQVDRIVAAIGREPGNSAMGVLSVLADATSGRGAAIQRSGSQLRDIVRTLNGVTDGGGGTSTIDAVNGAVQAIDAATPAGLDALRHSIAPMMTITRQRAALESLLTGATSTVGRIDDGFGKNLDRVKTFTSKIGPVVNALGDGASRFPAITRSVDNLMKGFLSIWDPVRQRLSAAAILQLTPNRQYTRADCPRYGDLAGASCSTAPVQAPAPTAPQQSLDFQPPPGLVSLDPGLPAGPELRRQMSRIPGLSQSAAAQLLFGPLATDGDGAPAGTGAGR